MKLAVRILIFIGYTISYFFLAMMATGGGHGNFIFFSAPLFSWVFLLIAICLTNNLKNKTVQVFFVILLLVHYLAITINVYEYSQSKYWVKDYVFWQRSPEANLFMIGLYLIGQIYIWSFLFRKNATVKVEEENTSLNLS